MKSIPFLLSILMISFLSCEKNEENPPINENEFFTKELITGYVQKGPFIIGTSISISEFDENLSQTGRNFNSQIIRNDGSFEIRNITLQNNLIEIKADGFYFNEVEGQISENRLTLYALSDILEQNSINVNVITTLEKARTEYLTGQGLSFFEAKKQAQKEVLAVFEIEKDDMRFSERLNIADSGDDDAILLALSIILQGNRTVAELTELLAKLSLDLRDNGVVDDISLGSALINSAKVISLSDIRDNIEKKFGELGIETTLPDFESRINHFIDNTPFPFTLGIHYPYDGKYGRNILSLSEGETIASPAHYSLKALLPEGFSLRIHVKQTSALNELDLFYGTYFIGEVSTYEKNSIAFGEQEWITKEHVTDADDRISFEGIGSGKIDIYENDVTVPTKTIHFHWDVPENTGVEYPDSGEFGDNILSLADQSILHSGQTYSIAAFLPTSLWIVLDMSVIRTSGAGTFHVNKSKTGNWSVDISDSYDSLFGRCVPESGGADMSVVFTGSGTCSVEVKIYNGHNTTILTKSFSWN
ncbi:MAG TPA: hypothetical protein PLK12_05420 [Prolixibacteraceae bacterium]|nr:hypothetical protein [Prolixibacteraceae bacterium]